MKNRIYEDLDDKKLELLLQEYAEEEGKGLIEENNRLREDSNFVVPEIFSRACQEAIDKAANREKHRAKWNLVQKSMKRVAVIPLVICLTGGALFCTVDAFKFYILNTFVTHKDTNTRVDVIEEERPETMDILENVWLPEGFEHVFSDNTSEDFQIHYFQNSDSHVIELYCVQSFSGTINVDVENTATAIEVDINGNDGWLEIKDNKHLSWYIPEKEILCDLFCELSLLDEDIIRIAKSIK